ncbi:MAG: ketoacyl-ACP synthase III [Nitrospirae bacterium]|nr:ketoacyl-ACP synthase III [Nitrospirota bacterium]
MGNIIAGLGSALPERRLTNADLEKMVKTSDAWIVERTGIRERRIAAEGESSSIFGARAATAALHQAKVRPEDLDGIIVATTTPDSIMPNTACLIQKEIGATRAFAFDLYAACSGFVHSLSVADSMLKSTDAGKILVVGVDLLSKVTDWQDRGTCILFGDGAGAAVLSKNGRSSRGIVSFHLAADGKGGNFLCIPGGGSARPPSLKMLEAREQFIHMNGPEVFKWAVRATEAAIRKEIERNGLKPDTVRLLMIHQANLRIIRSIQERLGFKDDQVFVNIDKYGNTSAASLPIALDEASREGRLREGDVVILAAMGGGLTWGAMTLRW